MPPSSPPDRTRLILAALASACLVVGLLWGLRWIFEDRVLSGHFSPDAALEAMTVVVTLLQVLAVSVAAFLAGLLVWIARRTREVRQWPPSGGWPAPRRLSEREAERIARWIHVGALLVGLVAAATAVAALS